MESKPSRFAEFFQQPHQPAFRGKFLSRLFGIFSEEMVRFWAADDRSPYRDIGRPTIFDVVDVGRSTLDFTFEDRATGRRFVVEMKCEIEFQGFRFLTLSNPSQLDHHTKPAFDQFRRTARDPQSCRVQVKGNPIDVAGAILIWGDVTDAGKSATIAACGFHDIIGMNRIMADLWLWQPKPFVAFIQSLSDWSNDLFMFLSGKGQEMLIKFENNDAEYISWRDSHPDGYVCNVLYSEGEHSWKSICVHKASCQSVKKNSYHGDSVWTTNKYFKICAEDLQSIENRLRSEGKLPKEQQLRRCIRRNCADA